jgi:predicted ATP-grasp superfamily ATP-dependent carboligase
MATPFLPDLSGVQPRRTISPKSKISMVPGMLNNHEITPHLRSMSYGARKLELKLKLKPKKSPIIIEGFPGFGFVATIAVEFLMDHLKMHSIGSFWSPRLAPIAFVHGKRIVQPLEIFHNDKYNIIVVEAVAGVAGMEWEVADALIQLYKKVNAKEIISIEGIGAPTERKEPAAYYFTNNDATKKKFENIGISQIRDGIIFGPSGALMLKVDKSVNSSFIFAETRSNLPDSRAAAKIIEILDQYLNLKIDYKPLLKKAAGFEEQIKDLLQQAKQATTIKQGKEDEQPYIG